MVLPSNARARSAMSFSTGHTNQTPVEDAKTRTAFSKLLHPPGIFVAASKAAAEAEISFRQVQVGMAHARTTDLIKTWPGRGSG
jgi:hypothetical protein